jgi:hypothetical protein
MDSSSGRYQRQARVPLRLLVGACCALETADTERLADLIEAFLASEDQAMRDAFVMGLVEIVWRTGTRRLRDSPPARPGSARQTASSPDDRLDSHLVGGACASEAGVVVLHEVVCIVPRSWFTSKQWTCEGAALELVPASGRVR